MIKKLNSKRNKSSVQGLARNSKQSEYSKGNKSSVQDLALHLKRSEGGVKNE